MMMKEEGSRVKGIVRALTPMVLAVLITCGCSGPGEGQAGGKDTVFVSIPPLAHLVERIAAGRVDVAVLVKPGASPETYAPTPRVIADLAQAPLFFVVGGLPFEQQLQHKAQDAFPGLTVMDTSVGFKRRPMAAGHDHGDHSHEEILDPHVWLSPAALEIMATRIADALSVYAPAHKEEFQTAKNAFLDELAGAHMRIAARLEPHKGRTFYVFHPAFSYFAQTYGLREVAIEAEGKRPEAKQLETTMEQARADGVRTIFVQPQFDRSGAEAVARGIKASLVELDPLAPDVIANLERTAEALAKALEVGS